MKLNLGAGGRPLDGWLNLDAGYEGDGIWLASLKECDAGSFANDIYPLEGLKDQSTECIRASHVLEHFPHALTLAVLREWVRVLKPGGVLQIAVPDFDRIIQVYQSGQPAPIEGWIMGGQTDERDYHKALFTEPALREALESLGLVDVQRWESEIQDCAALPISLNLQGTKADPDRQETAQEPQEAPSAPRILPAFDFRTGRVQAVMSCPRLGFTETMFDAYQALAPLRIPFTRHSGVFWSQSMAVLFEKAISEGAEYVLTLDYDTTFNRGDVERLLATIDGYPEIDALCALQSRRQGQSPLFAVAQYHQDDGFAHIPVEALAADTLPISTGHFGLTAIRTSAIAKLPRPWFMASPAPDGTWGEGKTDPDIAWWHAWKDAGLTLHLANRVVVGHLELVVAWPDQEMRTIHQHANDYTNQGKPAGAWR